MPLPEWLKDSTNSKEHKKYLALKEAYEQYEAAQKAYDDYVHSMIDLYDERNNGYEGKSKGLFRPMSLDELNSLKALSEQLLVAGSKMAAVLDKSGNRKSLEAKEERTNEDEAVIKGEKELLFDIRRSTRQANREFDAMANIDVNKIPSYMSMHRKASEVIIDTGNETLEKVGGSLSDRIPIRYMNENGELEEGFFTEDTSPEWTMNEVFDKARFVAPKLKKVFDYLEGYGKENPDNYKRIHDLFDINFKMTIDEETFRDAVPGVFKDLNVPEEYYKDLKFNKDDLSALHDIGERINTYQETKDLNNLAGIKPGSNINQRNTAMSDVARLLGCEKYVAKSTPMTIMIDGKAVHGSFMKKASGFGIDDVGNNFKPYNNKPFSVNYDELGKSCGSLLIIDYICGNIDRYSKNIFYDVQPSEDGKKMEFKGVIGIDNDLSFGDRILKTNQAVKNLPALDDIKTIPKDLAEKVKVLDKNTLSVILAKNQLTPEQIDACLDRVTKLQKKIAKPPKNFIVETYKKEVFDKLAEQKMSNTDSDFLNIPPTTPFKYAGKLIPQLINLFNEFTANFNRKINELTGKLLNKIKTRQCKTKEGKEFNKLRDRIALYEQKKKEIPNKYKDRFDELNKKYKFSDEYDTVLKKKYKLVEEDFKREYKTEQAEKRKVTGLARLHQHVYMQTTATMKGQASEVKNLIKRFKKLGSDGTGEYQRLMDSLNTLSETLNEVTNKKIDGKPAPANDVDINRIHKLFQNVQDKIRIYVPAATGENADKLVAAAECMDNICDIANKSREKQVYEINELMTKGVNEIAKSVSETASIKDEFGEGSFEYKLAKERLGAKQTLAASLGNLGPMTENQFGLNYSSIAKLVLIQHIGKLKGKDPALYGEYKDKIEQDPETLNKMAEILTKGDSFTKALVNVNPFSALITKPHIKIAAELEGLSKFNSLDDIAAGMLDYDGKAITQPKPEDLKEPENKGMKLSK